MMPVVQDANPLSAAMDRKVHCRIILSVIGNVALVDKALLALDRLLPLYWLWLCYVMKGYVVLMKIPEKLCVPQFFPSLGACQRCNQSSPEVDGMDLRRICTSRQRRRA